MSFSFSVCVLSFLLVGCYAHIQGWSQESFRSPGFTLKNLKNEGIALLPVIILEDTRKREEESPERIPDAPYTQPVPPGKAGEKQPISRDAYRVILSEILLSKIRSNFPDLKIVTPGDAMKRINDAGLTTEYHKFNTEFPKIGLDGSLLRRFGETLHSRYIFVTQAVLTEMKTDTSLIIVWTFGRKSVLQAVKVSGQIWDTVTGNQVWEGLGVGYNRLSSYEHIPLTEEVAHEAFESLLKNIYPKEK